MRLRSHALIVAALLIASAAQAGPLLSATWTSLIQGIQLTVTNSGATCTDTLTTHVQQSIVCPTAGLGATGSANAASYSVSLAMPLFSVRQFTSGVDFGNRTGAVYTKATLAGSQVVSGINSSAKATMGVSGFLFVKVASHAVKGVNASMLTHFGTTLVRVPLSVGKADTFYGYFVVLGHTHYITVDFYPWTPHTKTFTGLTAVGLPSRMTHLPDVVAMGSFNLSAGGGGTVTLVSPSKVSIHGSLSQRRTASYTTLKLTYAPEPPIVLLLGAGVASLVLLGSRKRGKLCSIVGDHGRATVECDCAAGCTKVGEREVGSGPWGA